MFLFYCVIPTRVACILSLVVGILIALKIKSRSSTYNFSCGNMIKLYEKTFTFAHSLWQLPITNDKIFHHSHWTNEIPTTHFEIIWTADWLRQWNIVFYYVHTFPWINCQTFPWINYFIICNMQALHSKKCRFTFNSK